MSIARLHVVTRRPRSRPVRRLPAFAPGPDAVARSSACARSRTDPRYPRYPALPVVACPRTRARSRPGQRPSPAIRTCPVLDASRGSCPYSADITKRRAVNGTSTRRVSIQRSGGWCEPERQRREWPREPPDRTTRRREPRTSVGSGAERQRYRAAPIGRPEDPEARRSGECGIAEIRVAPRKARPFVPETNGRFDSPEAAER